jgi:hypothetical protein
MSNRSVAWRSRSRRSKAIQTGFHKGISRLCGHQLDDGLDNQPCRGEVKLAVGPSISIFTHNTDNLGHSVTTRDIPGLPEQ